MADQMTEWEWLLFDIKGRPISGSPFKTPMDLEKWRGDGRDGWKIIIEHDHWFILTDGRFVWAKFRTDPDRVDEVRALGQEA